MLVRSSEESNAIHKASPRARLPNPASNGRAIIIDQRKSPSEEGLEASLCSAMLVADKELADVVREVEGISKALRSDERDTRALQIAANPAVWGAVRHVIMERELRYLALTDDLTGLYNRRGFFAAATQQLKRARRNAQTMLLFFCDVDNLAQINDCYGHRDGDLALVHTVNALEETFRDSDILARLGGHEFAVLALDAASNHKGLILSRLEGSLKRVHTTESRYELSLSVGVARFDPQHAVSLGELMEQAYQGMHEERRNRPRRA
jgi:diguanylate cyclase (GGDEF)-like protein